MSMLEIDRIANLWNQTKDPKYKNLWYQLIKEFANGPHCIKRRVVSPNPFIKKNDRGSRIDK